MKLTDSLDPYAVEIKLILAVLAAVLGIAIAAYGVNHYLNLRVAAAVGELRGEVIKTTAGTIADGDKVAEQRTAREATVADSRNTYQNEKKDIYRADPTVRDRDSVVVPERMRHAFRARRLARERSAGVQELGEGSGQAPAPEQR